MTIINIDTSPIINVGILGDDGTDASVDDGTDANVDVGSASDDGMMARH